MVTTIGLLAGLLVFLFAAWGLSQYGAPTGKKARILQHFDMHLADVGEPAGNGIWIGKSPFRTSRLGSTDLQTVFFEINVPEESELVCLPELFWQYFSEHMRDLRSRPSGTALSEIPFTHGKNVFLWIRNGFALMIYPPDRPDIAVNEVLTDVDAVRKFLAAITPKGLRRK